MFPNLLNVRCKVQGARCKVWVVGDNDLAAGQQVNVLLAGK